MVVVISNRRPAPPAFAQSQQGSKDKPVLCARMILRKRPSKWSWSNLSIADKKKLPRDEQSIFRFDFV
jgi:hypothetical protein